MKKIVQRSSFALASASLLILSACGGGGSGGAPASVAQTVLPGAKDFVLSGTAATGAALAGATIVVTIKTVKKFAIKLPQPMVHIHARSHSRLKAHS
jgi:hypothetical protein